MRRISNHMMMALMVACVAGTGACSHGLPFADYQQESFDLTPITTTQDKWIKIVNPYPDAPQHVRAIAFDAGGNPGGNFSLKGVRIGARDLPLHDISIPAHGDIELHVVYTPKNLETTVADFGGWETGAPDRFVPHAPAVTAAPPTATTAAAMLLTSSPVAGRRSPVTAVSSLEVAVTGPRRLATGDALAVVVHRALLVMTFDFPKEGVLQVELIGTTAPGPNGEISASGGGGGGSSSEPGTCAAGGTTACFTGDFAIELPGIMKGAVSAPLSGPLPITIDGSSARIDLNHFPTALFVVQGNGPGEPLEGKPLSAISLAVSGVDDVVANGTFDGAALTLSEVSFRVRLYFSAMTIDALDSTVAPVDFQLTGLTLTTITPLSGGKITLGVETTLGKNPTGNALADPFLSGAKVVVKMTGALQLP